MKFFQKKCNHDWEILRVSNIYRNDSPDDRLCYCRCKNCGEEVEQWMDIFLLRNTPIFETVADIQWADVVSGFSELTIPTPDRCMNCKLHYVDSGLNVICIPAKNIIPKDGVRPDWCPLQPRKEDDEK